MVAAPTVAIMGFPHDGPQNHRYVASTLQSAVDNSPYHVRLYQPTFALSLLGACGILLLIVLIAIFVMAEFGAFDKD